MQRSVSTQKSLLIALVAAGGLLAADEAEAQYRNYTFGFEGGYMFLGENTELDAHNISLGMFGGYKASDHWWFYSKASLSFPGQQNNLPNTVILLHIVPISVRYYFYTDAFRPWVGLTNAFQQYFNTNAISQTTWWGPGVHAGVDFKLQRDLFLGFEGDAHYLINFEGPNTPVFSGFANLTFFL